MRKAGADFCASTVTVLSWIHYNVLLQCKYVLGYVASNILVRDDYTQNYVPVLKKRKSE